MDDNTKGAMYMLAAALFFALMAAAVKMTGDLPTVQKVFFRNFIGVFVSAFMLRRGGHSFKGNDIPKLVQRSVLGLLGVAGYFYSISRMPLADAVIINKLSPFFTMVFAAIFLKERISRVQIGAIILALAGAGVVTRPQFNISVIPALMGIMGALMGAGAYTTIRYLRDSDSPQTIVFYFTVISSAAMVPFMLAGQFVFPSPLQMLGLMLIGIFATAAQMLLTYAYRYAPAGEVSVYFYADVIISMVISLVFFAELPDLFTVLGAVLIIGGGIVNFVHVRKANNASTIRPDQSGEATG